MKTSTLIVLALACALAAPAAAAHVFIYFPNANGGCTVAVVGDHDTDIHGDVWIFPCSPRSEGPLP